MAHPAGAWPILSPRPGIVPSTLQEVAAGPMLSGGAGTSRRRSHQGGVLPWIRLLCSQGKPGPQQHGALYLNCLKGSPTPEARSANREGRPPPLWGPGAAGSGLPTGAPGLLLTRKENSFISSHSPHLQQTRQNFLQPRHRARDCLPCAFLHLSLIFSLFLHLP